MTTTIRPITDEELASPEKIQAWMRETAPFLEIKEMVHYKPDELYGGHVKDGGDSFTITEAVLDFLHTAFEIRKNRDFLDKCPSIFASALGLSDLERMKGIEQ
jgi:hypothetical protein